MHAAPGLGQEIIAQARELHDHALQGANANSRPDLVRRLNRAGHALDAASGADEQAAAVRLLSAEALRALDSLEVDLRSRCATLGDPVRTRRLGAELAGAQERSDRFKLVSREWPHIMAHGLAKVSSDVEFDLRARVRDLVSEAELAIDATDPDKYRDQLDAQLRGRLVIEADRSYQRVLTGAHAVADELATLFALPVPNRIPEPPVTAPQRLVAELPDRHRPSPAGPLPARLLTIMLPGYSGIVITLLLSRLLTPHLPGWLIAVCAVAGAIALSSAKASGERKRRLDRRRADATKAMRATTDEFQLALAKQVRDGVRVVEHDLRRETTATVTRLGSAIAGELATFQTATEVTRRAPAELAAVAKDLDSIAELRNRALELQRATPDDPGADLAPPRPLTAMV